MSDMSTEELVEYLARLGLSAHEAYVKMTTHSRDLEQQLKKLQDENQMLRDLYMDATDSKNIDAAIGKGVK